MICRRRRQIAMFYKEGFKDMQKVICLNERKHAMSSWHIFPMRVIKNRDKIFDIFRTKGIGVNLRTYLFIFILIIS